MWPRRHAAFFDEQLGVLSRVSNRFLLVFGDTASMETETEHGRFEESDNSREDASEIRPRAPERPGWIWQNKVRD